MRILIIDDEDDIREATQICLEVTGDWEVLTASSGKEGLSKAQVEQPDVILLDVMMPDMDGLATLERLQAAGATARIPVILLTAKAQPAEQRRFSKLAVAAVILKPYDPFTLSEQVIDAMERKRPA
ncbi:response regulator [Candidatus Gracilibacteria bacterium]|jgi:two-component system, OmpR family, alkaline phosphatase synthesis response regulator PhoP|nr:response regulator [Candidatus Gracilibacteria bacterium]NJM86703.1 response regulator [Hydrococcus sp. RU_2_2]NJP20892.1 response regulator [Hydrococcus sp. CRU_1_1]NJQ98970.1 response regulator [Hydrococcus sp. CSU_1_8]